MEQSIQSVILQSYQLLDRELEFKNFRLSNIPIIQDLVRNGSVDDLVDLADHIEEIRGKYFMQSTQRVDQVFQSIAQIMISIKIKTKNLGVENYLRYFDPKSAYALRMQALIGFRLLEDPAQDIEKKFLQTSDLVYQSYHSDPKTINKAMDVLKEYIDRLFGIRFVLFSERKKRYDSISAFENEPVQFRLHNNDFRVWLLSQCDANYVSQYASGDNQVQIQDDDFAVEDNLLVDKLQQSQMLIQTLQKDIEEQDKIIHDLNQEKTYLNAIIESLQHKIELIEKNKSERSQEKLILIHEYEEQINSLSKEKEYIAGEYKKYLALMSEVEKGQKEIEDIRAENEQLRYQLSNLQYFVNDSSILESKGTNGLQCDRSLYKIDIIGGSAKVMKKYRQLQEQLDISEFGIRRQQLGDPICDYEGQKKLKSSVIKNNLIMGNTTFLLAIQTDHETEFANLCKDPDVDQLITVFAEDDQYNGQSLSNERFKHYLGLAIEKYERFEGNLF